MIEEQGRVFSIEGDAVWVETERQSTCSGCKAKNGCGQHLVDKYRPSSAVAYIKAASDGSLAEGDRVMVGIPENSLLKASSVVYLLPLLLLMGALWLSQLSSLSDGVTLILGTLALLAGFIPARRLGVKEEGLCRVKVVRVLSKGGSPAGVLPVRSV